MFTVRATKKLRDRIGASGDRAAQPAGTTRLGDWYATVLFWRPQVALFVDERTLLPVLMPLAPAVSVVRRFPAELAVVLEEHGVPEPFIDAEVREMGSWRVEPTNSRSVLGVMNEFARLAEYARDDMAAAADLVAISLELARTPCGPLYARHVSPDRELAAIVSASWGRVRPLRLPVTS